ncbi:MAG: hypothetical protein ABIF92_02475 [archaeon]
MQFEDVMKLLLGKSKQKEGGETQDNSVQPEASELKQKKQKGSWRNNLHPGLHSEINKLVHNTHNHRDAYKRTFDVKNAQLWVALAQLSKRITELENLAGAPGHSVTGAQNTIETEALTSRLAESQESEQEVHAKTSQTLEKEQPVHQMLISGQLASSAQPQARPGQL